MEWLIISIIFFVLILFSILIQKSSYDKEVPGKTVWLLWLQGWDKAPWLQQRVRDSWIKHNPEWNVELVDSKNLRKYVDVPYINKIQASAAKSDVIRLSLLAKHGGVWADSTMLCMAPLDEWIYDALDPVGIWMYHGGADGQGPASWFIVSAKQSYIMKKWKNACDEYWSSRAKEDEYFWMDGLFNKLLKTDAKFAQEWNSVPYISCDAPGQAHALAGKTQSNDPEVKRILGEYPPYAVKLSSRNWNGVFFNENMTDSNAYYAIQEALKSGKPFKPHKMDYKPGTGFSDSVAVVADYGNGEDVKKILDESKSRQVLVYDKGNFCKNAPDCYCRPRRNVGREQETFLHFVTTHNDKLPNDIIFLPTPLAKHGRFERYKNILKTGGNSYPPEVYLGAEADFELPVYEERKMTRASEYPFKKWYEKHIGEWVPNTPMIWNGIYKTSRDRILEKPRNFFANLHEQTKAANDTEVGHFLERSMTSIY
jgi:hypothetical protein